MKLLKPSWVSHDELPIFSVDIHPDGSRFATGGQGEDSGRIVIWNMAPIVNEDIENDENIPKMLCQMDNHLACVNCVRWSFSGKFLASGGDDKLVMIWKISKYPAGGSSVFGGGGKVNVETWRCSTTLRGHNGDVLDMAWSPHDAWLASCSVDNTVIVWNALKMPEMVAVLKGHSGLVKGVAWDPVGKYIASQSDDKTLRVWRTADWQQDSVIHEPFEECGGTTHVLRLSWSPDGQYLVSAHAMNGGGPTAQIVEREGWRQDKDFVGHRKAVTCVRFNCNILQKHYRSSSKPQQYCCCAIGSRDRSLSVWLTALKRPLVVLHELFSNSVLDLSWSFTGLQLMACSWDGSVAFVEFSEEELGKPLTLEEKSTLHERMYGKSLSASAASQASIVETPELLAVREKAEQQQQQQLTNSNNLSEQNERRPATPLTPLKGPINKQIETRTSDGKRRITPMFIPPAPDTGDVPMPFGATGSQTPTFLSSSEPKSCIVIEKRDDIVDPNVSHASKSCDSTPSGGRGTGNMHALSNSSPPAETAMAGTQVVISAHARKMEKSATTGRTNEGKLEVHKSDRGLAVKRRLDKDSRLATKFPSPKRIRPMLVSSEKPASQTSTQQIAAVPGLQTDEIPALTLPQLRMGKRAVVQVSGARRRVEIENGACSSPYGALTRLRVFPSGSSASGGENPEPEWEAVLGSTACGTAANNHVVAVACEDYTLHLMDIATGQRPMPPLVLASAVSRLALGARSHVMAVTCSGGVSVWDVGRGKVLVRNESLMPIMQTTTGSVVTILSCLLTENGCPLVSLSTGRAYMFSSDLGNWLLLGDSNDPVHRSAAHRTFTQLLPGEDTSSLPLASLQSHIRCPISASAGRLLHGTPAGPLCTVTFLEQQLSACRALDSRREYRTWLVCLARFLVQEGLEARLRLLCDDLLGPTHGHAKLSRTWQNSTMGFSKHTLLKEVLSLMGSNLRLQRVYTEYHEQLSMLEGRLTNGMNQ